jgi:hypothetical protein
MLSIVIIIVYFHSIIALDILNTTNLKQTIKFDPKNVSTFFGFDALDFDGKEFNPFEYDLENISNRFMV